MKMKKKYVIILILALIVMLAAGTYAYFMLLISNDEDSTELYTGTLSVDYSQGDIVYLDSFYPRTEPTLTDLDYAYSNTFSVTNTGTLDGKLSMKLEINDNTFTNGAIKYVLYNSNGYKLLYGKISNVEDTYLISNVLLKSKASVKYTLIMWLNETGEQQNKDENCKLIGKITANLEQYIEN